MTPKITSDVRAYDLNTQQLSIERAKTIDEETRILDLTHDCFLIPSLVVLPANFLSLRSSHPSKDFDQDFGADLNQTQRFISCCSGILFSLLAEVYCRSVFEVNTVY